MTTFLLDVWQDLREKRLWPVAIGLGAAIVAIPIVLFKPSSQPSSQPLPLSGGQSAVKLPVVNVNSGPTEGSKLETFAEHNPFQPLNLLSGASGASSTQGGSSGGATAGSAGANGGTNGGGGTTGASSAASSGGGSSSSGSSTSGGSSSSSAARGGTTSTTTTTTTHWFHYTVDLRFGKAGWERTLKNVADLTLLPSTKNPVLLFMGVSIETHKAVFFLPDANYVAHGSGQCNAGGNACRFVSLSLPDHASEAIQQVNGGTVYDLQLLSVNKTAIDPSAPSGSSKVSTASADWAPPLSPADVVSSEALVPTLLTLSDIAVDSH